MFHFLMREASFLKSSALLVGLLAVYPSVIAQLSAPNCTDESWQWTFNSKGQNPCTVAVYLEAVCSSGGFTLPPLLPGNHYTGPSAAQGGDICMCNSVVYTLISACDACQGSEWINWSEYNANCSAVTTMGSLPSDLSIPSGTGVPAWAYLNITDDTWDNTTAFADISAPESSATGGATTIVPSSTGASSASVTQGASTTASSSSSTSAASSSGSGSSSHTGAIAGGVVGGVVGLAAIAGLVAFFLIRRRRNRVPPSALYSGTASTPGGPAASYGGLTTPSQGQWEAMPAMSESPAAPRKYYDPSDPSTFPTSPSPSSPTIHTTNNTYNSRQSLQPNRSTYNGLPEV